MWDLITALGLVLAVEGILFAGVFRMRSAGPCTRRRRARAIVCAPWVSSVPCSASSSSGLCAAERGGSFFGLCKSCKATQISGTYRGAMELVIWCRCRFFQLIHVTMSIVIHRDADRDDSDNAIAASRQGSFMTHMPKNHRTGPSRCASARRRIRDRCPWICRSHRGTDAAICNDHTCPGPAGDERVAGAAGRRCWRPCRVQVRPESFADLVERVMPAVVNISAATTTSSEDRTFPQLPPGDAV